MFTVYKTTNLLNGMFYIGVHKTDNPNDDYLGSGVRLNRAIKKYGLLNFKKEILFSFGSVQDAYEKERELVCQDLVNSKICYNLKLGGKGGWDHLDSATRTLAGKLGAAALSARLLNDEEFRMSVSKYRKELAAKNGPLVRHRKNFKQSEETKQKIKDSLKKRIQNGEIISPPSNVGTTWITDGVSNNLVKDLENIPNGWRIGRTISMKWITDGMSNKFIKSDQEIPNGWRYGRIILAS